MVVGDGSQHQGSRPAFHAFVVTIGDRHVDAWVAVGGRPKDDSLFADPQPPRIVVGRTDEFDFGSIGAETKESSRKTQVRFFAWSSWPRSVIALHRPDPVIESILKITYAAVRIALIPAGE